MSERGGLSPGVFSVGGCLRGSCLQGVIYSYTPAKFRVCVSNGCIAIVLRRFCWLSETNKHTSDTLKIIPAFAIAAGNIGDAPLAAGCCHLANDVTYFTGDRQTNKRTSSSRKTPHLRRGLNNAICNHSFRDKKMMTLSYFWLRHYFFVFFVNDLRGFPCIVQSWETVVYCQWNTHTARRTCVKLVVTYLLLRRKPIPSQNHDTEHSFDSQKCFSCAESSFFGQNARQPTLLHTKQSSRKHM